MTVKNKRQDPSTVCPSPSHNRDDSPAVPPFAISDCNIVKELITFDAEKNFTDEPLLAYVNMVLYGRKIVFVDYENTVDYYMAEQFSTNTEAVADDTVVAPFAAAEGRRGGSVGYGCR